MTQNRRYTPPKAKRPTIDTDVAELLLNVLATANFTVSRAEMADANALLDKATEQLTAIVAHSSGT